MERLKDWYVFDPTDFDGVMIDVTKWDENAYSLAFSFYCTKEVEHSDEPQVGFTLCTMIFGQSLKECHERIMEVLDTGFFDEIEISSDGTVYDREGEEIESISWNTIANEGDSFIEEEPPPTLH